MFEKGNQAWKGRKHTVPTEETRRKMSEAAKRRWQIKHGALPMPPVPVKKARGWAWKGKRLSDETRRKMSAARSGRRRGTEPRNMEEGYRLLVAAVISRALKDNVASFFNTDTGKYYCDFIGVDPVKLLENSNMHITQPTGQFATDIINQ